jgi:hypothetical protein
MADTPAGKPDKVESRASRFESPRDICADAKLSRDEKKRALDTWEQDARQLLTASNEGMAGPEEGVNPDDHHRLGEVVRAKAEIGEPARRKPAH